MNHLPFRIDQFNSQRHFAERMRGAGQAGVEGADGNFDVIEQAFRHFMAMQVAPSHLTDGFVHCLIIVGSGNDQVGHRDQIVFISPIMVEERAAWRFDDADAFHLAFAFDHQIIAEPVSYTHLDVYKRQLIGSLIIAGSVQAEESSVIDKTKASVVHVGELTVHGIERGATAAGHGLNRGVQATKRVFGKVADKLGGSSAG